MITSYKSKIIYYGLLISKRSDFLLNKIHRFATETKKIKTKSNSLQNLQ